MIKKFIKNIFINNNVFIGRTSSVEDIQHLINKWKPKSLKKVELTRIGSDIDGGYIVPRDFGKCEILVSPGVGDNNSFERSFESEVVNSKIFQIDGTIKEVPSGLRNTNFSSVNLGSTNDLTTITLDQWMHDIGVICGPNKKYLLQIDIEGAEYSSITVTSDDTLDLFSIIVIELHNLDRLLNVDFCERFKLFTEKILKNHTVVHLHPNNRRNILKYKGLEIHPTLEATLVRNDDYSIKEEKPLIPNKDDRPCDPTLKDIRLSKDWL